MKKHKIQISHGKKAAAAFTLIELLIVIAIIGLLASIILVALNNTRAKGREAAVTENVQQMGKALELYFSTNNTYPAGNYASYNAQEWSALQTTLSPYMKTLPQGDTNQNIIYWYYGPGLIVNGVSDQQGIQCDGSGSAGYMIIAWGASPNAMSNDGGINTSAYEFFGGSGRSGHLTQYATCQ